MPWSHLHVNPSSNVLEIEWDVAILWLLRGQRGNNEIYYCICRIFRRGFIFTNFASRVLVANLTTRKNIYLRS